MGQMNVAYRCNADTRCKGRKPLAGNAAMNSIARTKKSVNACATGNQYCKQRHGNPCYLFVHQAPERRITRAFGPVQHGDVCRYLPLSATFGMLKQMDATASILAHLTFCFRTSLIKGWHCVPAFATLPVRYFQEPLHVIRTDDKTEFAGSISEQ
jgi:hypothetical protein